MRGGNSPPPKFKEENLFSEGDSRPSNRPTYKTKEEADNWGWGEPEDKISDLFAQINNRSFDPERRRRRYIGMIWTHTIEQWKCRHQSPTVRMEKKILTFKKRKSKGHP